MIVLRCEPEDGKRPALILADDVFIVWPKQTGDGEFSAFDPNAGGILDRFERHHPTIGAGHEAVVISRLSDRTRSRLELAVEELVERLERVQRVEDLVHVEVMECYKRQNVGGRSWRVVLDTLLYRKRLEQFTCW